MMQEHQVGSLNNCISEFQQLACAQRLELQDAQHGFIEARREQARLQEYLSLKEKVLRNTQIRNVHELGEMKRALELRVDEFSVQKYEKVMKQYKGSLRICRICRNRRILWMIQENFKKWHRITVGDCFAFPVNQQWFQVLVPWWVATNACHLTHGLHLDYWKTFLVIKILHLIRPEILLMEFIVVRHQERQNQFHKQWRQGTFFTRDDKQDWDTIPMSTFARRVSTMSSFILVEIPQNSMVGQQRQQISGLHFDNFSLIPSCFWFGK